jgi:hypothetical protein
MQSKLHIRLVAVAMNRGVVRLDLAYRETSTWWTVWANAESKGGGGACNLSVVAHKQVDRCLGFVRHMTDIP